jgi:hypothetical protein
MHEWSRQKLASLNLHTFLKQTFKFPTLNCFFELPEAEHGGTGRYR